jgi:hypothetical protein
LPPTFKLFHCITFEELCKLGYFERVNTIKV